jgi:hypothetical protein
MKLSRVLPVAAFALLGAGCHTYKYIDMTVSFDQATFDDADILTIARCRILVSGADSDNFLLPKCPNASLPDPHVVGEFEFSTFADSGTMNFELQAYTGLQDSPACLIGDGKAAILVSGLTTIPGLLTVAKTGPGCSSVTPVNDGSP